MLEDEELDVSLFNRPWVSAFTMGKVITIIGKYDGGSRVTALQYNFKPMKEQLGIHPVYNVREGITQKELVRYIDKAWQAPVSYTHLDVYKRQVYTEGFCCQRGFSQGNRLQGAGCWRSGGAGSGGIHTGRYASGVIRQSEGGGKYTDWRK